MAIKYYRRRGAFEAVYYDGTNLEEVTAFTRGRVYYSHKHKQSVLLSKGTETILKTGDYIAADKDGEFDVWGEDIFETMFEEA